MKCFDDLVGLSKQRLGQVLVHGGRLRDFYRGHGKHQQAVDMGSREAHYEPLQFLLDEQHAVYKYENKKYKGCKDQQQHNGEKDKE